MTAERRRANPAWLALAVVSAVTAASALASFLLSNPASFEVETHVPWSTFSQAYPTIADQFELVARSAQLFALTVGLMALAISVYPFRAGQRWAWVVMWLLPLSMLPGALGSAFGRGDLRLFGLGSLFLGAVAVVAIIGARHQFFPLPAAREEEPADVAPDSD